MGDHIYRKDTLMHPDNIIAGLRAELERLNPNDENYDARKAAIEAEINATDKLDRPAALPETPSLAADPDRVYLDGLKAELARSAKERWPEIKAEIDRVEQLIKDRVLGEASGADEEQALSTGEPEASEVPAVESPGPESGSDTDLDSEASSTAGDTTS